MASSYLLCFTICSLVLFNVCLAQLEQVSQMSPTTEQRRGQQQRWVSECQIERLNAAEPHRKIESEAGNTEIWDENDEQFQCAGVTAVRHTIERKGLLLPAYANAPRLLYVVQGRGIQGQAIPGCPETFHSESGSQRKDIPRDQHQKVRRIREGDVVAVPTGVTDWIYNDGDSQLILVQIVDVGNDANQLDQNMRKFYLAGNPQQELQGQRELQGQSERERQSRHRRPRGSQQDNAGSVLSGFSERILAEAFNIDTNLAQKIQNRKDRRGIIVQVREELRVVMPESGREEEEHEREQGRRLQPLPINGIEETFCSARMKHNIADPKHADVYTTRGGRISYLNAADLPILQHLQLSAEYGKLYRNRVESPHYNQNSHSIVYIIRGDGRMQVVGDNGESVYNGQVREGQMIVVPQNYVVIKGAGENGLEFIAFKTHDTAKISSLAGRTSILRAMPVEVLMNSYQISREDARRLKEGRQDVTA
ncbi:hypothetical protein HS088_TW14G00901 [Tripterygium wilfordii]|uniref:Cupin type-1 domain-containing protein n=1 Tax=Tripterygium wilfordii TaxID=458696 RepID=A0A7J7CRX4_TRIWF|nr:legumin B-like [Tripterygium wilfordii]KAF5736748.1 hypothetical protein HS088_TW14G00901 [Tripterygium wilfordii]